MTRWVVLRKKSRGKKSQANAPLKVLSHQIFKSFYHLRYYISTFCADADGFEFFVFIFYINI
jgi:hypothetical protein